MIHLLNIAYYIYDRNVPAAESADCSQETVPIAKMTGAGYGDGISEGCQASLLRDFMPVVLLVYCPTELSEIVTFREGHP